MSSKRKKLVLARMQGTINVKTVLNKFLTVVFKGISFVGDPCTKMSSRSESGNQTEGEGMRLVRLCDL